MAVFPPNGQFKSGLGGDGSDALANNRFQFIEFEHVPTGDIVRFKAYVTDYSDNYTSDWNDEEAFGRMDPISTFKGTKRIISISWDIVAAGLEEAIDNWERLSLLLSFLYPTYESGDGGPTTIKNSPLFRLRFMNLIQRADRTGVGLLGKVTGFENKPDVEHGFFDPLPNGGSEAKVYPQTIRIAAEYTVLHEHALGYTENKTPRTNFAKFPYGDNKRNFSAPGRKTNASRATTSRGDRKVGSIDRALTAKGGR